MTTGKSQYLTRTQQELNLHPTSFRGAMSRHPVSGSRIGGRGDQPWPSLAGASPLGRHYLKHGLPVATLPWPTNSLIRFHAAIPSPEPDISGLLRFPNALVSR